MRKPRAAMPERASRKHPDRGAEAPSILDGPAQRWQPNTLRGPSDSVWDARAFRRTKSTASKTELAKGLKPPVSSK